MYIGPFHFLQDRREHLQGQLASSLWYFYGLNSTVLSDQSLIVYRSTVSYVEAQAGPRNDYGTRENLAPAYIRCRSIPDELVVRFAGVRREATALCCTGALLAIESFADSTTKSTTKSTTTKGTEASITGSSESRGGYIPPAQPGESFNCC